jgi:hypothetical protein
MRFEFATARFGRQIRHHHGGKAAGSYWRGWWVNNQSEEVGLFYEIWATSHVVFMAIFLEMKQQYVSHHGQEKSRCIFILLESEESNG